MADAPTVYVEQNGYRNVILRVDLLSDGSGVALQKIYDATSTGVFGVSKQGQTFYPGIHTTLIGLDYDLQDMKAQLFWEATANVPLRVLGQAPEDFDWTRFGGIRCPVVAGATGSILLSTINQAPNSTLSLILYLRKNVPVS